MGRAIASLSALLGPLAVAPLYRSPALSQIVQPDYLNTALLAPPTLAPADLMAVAKELEWRCGRRAGRRHGPRPLDIDILLWGDLQLTLPELTIPHPGLATRAFVLAPLADLDADLRVPPRGERVGELLSRLPRPLEIQPVPWEQRSARHPPGS